MRFAIGSKRGFTGLRIATAQIDAVTECSPEEVGIVQPETVEDQDVFLHLPERCEVGTATVGGPGCVKGSRGGLYHLFEPGDDLAGTVAGVWGPSNQISRVL